MNQTAETLFFKDSGMDPARVQTLVDGTLAGADDGELFLEYRESEAFAYDDGRLKVATFDSSQGFGLRCVAAESTGYAHATELSEAAIARAADAAGSVRGGHKGNAAEGPKPTNRRLYTDLNPLTAVPFDAKTTLLAEIDAYARSRDPRVKQVSASLTGEWQVVHIMRAGGQMVSDIRPLVRLNVSVVVEQDGRQESGSHGVGGREGYAVFIDPTAWKTYVDEALRQALVNLDSRPAPAGEMQVVLGPGWPGILLHEAIGHGLEGDFNRKKTSAFAGLLGKRVAAPGVTVVDDGALDARRGSLSVDDEGTPTGRTTLIEDGILVNYLQDRQNARLMGVAPTGNGRRQSFQWQVRVFLHRGLPHREWKDRRAGERCNAHRQWRGCADAGEDGRQRFRDGPRHRHLRQRRTGRAGWRRPANHADRRTHRRRHRRRLKSTP